MRIPGLKTARKISQWIGNRFFPGALVLGYHRVASVEHDIFYNCVSPENFSQQMEMLRMYANPVDLETLMSQVLLGKLSPKSVCVTMDDGYVDNLINAKPILERYQIPVTVFVTTGYIGREFWWDQLERYIQTGIILKRKIELEFDNKSYQWDLQSTSMGDAINSISKFLRPLTEEVRNQMLSDIRTLSCNEQSLDDSSTRGMTPDELVSLGNDGLIEIGSHTISHPILTQLTYTDRLHEFAESKRILEEIISKPVKGFSFPNGQFSKDELDMVHLCGYKYACVSRNGTVRQNTNISKLPRFWIGNIGGAEFYKWLRLWSV